LTCGAAAFFFLQRSVEVRTIAGFCQATLSGSAQLMGSQLREVE
jgi:hypothetical protein